MCNIIKKIYRTIVRGKKKVQFAEDIEPVELTSAGNIECLNYIPEDAIKELFGIKGGKSRHAMHYSCEKCMNMQLIYLDHGLEDGNENSKPVPFTIRCRKCGGVMRHVLWNDDVYLSKDEDIPFGAYYFANLPQYRCGVVRQRGVDDVEKFESKEVSEEI